MQPKLIGKRLALSLALSSAVLPLVLIGCGGGSGPLVPRPSPRPTTAPTAAPTATPLPELSFTFKNGQRARFFGGTVSQTGVVNAQITVTGAASAPLQIPPGTYPATGTIDPSTGDFTLTQGAGSSYNFGVAGKLPTSSADGLFTFTAQNGATENGSIPRGTVVIPTSAPTVAPTTAATAPTVAPTTAPTIPPATYQLTTNLVFSNVASNTTFVPSQVTTFNDLSGEAYFNNQTFRGKLVQNLELNATSRSTTDSRLKTDLVLDLGPLDDDNQPLAFAVGQRIPLADSNTNSVSLAQVAPRGNSVVSSRYRTVSGFAIVRALGTNSITVELENAVFRPRSDVIGGGVGGFTINGTLIASGLEVDE